MGSFFGGKKSTPSKANVPIYPTRDEIIILYQKYYHVIPDDDTIAAHMGNPGGINAIEKMLKNSLGTSYVPDDYVAPPSIQNPSESPNLIPIKVASGVNPFGMSYWRNINQHYLSDYITMFVSRNDQIMLIQLDKNTLKVAGEHYLGINHTGEGCWFSALEPNRLFIPVGNQLRAYDISNNTFNVAFRLNADENVWQAHGDYYDSQFSCTVKDSDWAFKEWYAGSKRFSFKGNPDECQIDKSGEWVLAKEDNYNRIIYIKTGAERIISDADGAVGHSDNGFGFTLGEFDKANEGGAVNMIDFTTGKQMIHFTTGIWNLGYVSLSNAKPKSFTQSKRDFYLISTPIELIQVFFNGGSRVLCPINSHPSEYKKRVKANLCPEGQYAAFTDAEFNAYIVRIPE